MDMVIRKWELKDLPTLVEIVKEVLEHGAYASDIYDRIRRIYAHDSYITFVAELDGRVIGFVGLLRGLAFELDGEYVRIISLAVRTEYQNQGVGTRLAARAEDYANEIGASYIVISSGLRRADAHLFYNGIGYAKSGYTFVKALHGEEERRTIQPDIFTPIPHRSTPSPTDNTEQWEDNKGYTE